MSWKPENKRQFEKWGYIEIICKIAKIQISSKVRGKQ
jgi:hypothetical protein